MRCIAVRITLKSHSAVYLQPANDIHPCAAKCFDPCSPEVDVAIQPQYIYNLVALWYFIGNKQNHFNFSCCFVDNLNSQIELNFKAVQKLFSPNCKILQKNDQLNRRSNTNSVSLNVLSVHGTVAVEETNVPNLPGPCVYAKAPRLVLISHQSPIIHLCNPACMPTVPKTLQTQLQALDGQHEP